MEKKLRVLILEELKKKAQEQDDEVSDTESVDQIMRSVDFIPYDEGMFGNHEMFMEDFQTSFRPKDINQAIKMSANKAWITRPDFARKRGIPHLYILDPNKASIYEKYFGVKSKYGYMPTPVSDALQKSLFSKTKVKRKAPAAMIEVPPDYGRGLSSGMRIMTWDPQTENEIIKSAQGIPLGSESISEELDLKSKHLERAISKFIQEDAQGEKKLVKLHRTLDGIKDVLNKRIDSLISEQRDKNRSIRFNFSKDEYEDVVKQAILRLLLSELTGPGGPFEGVELGIPDNYTIL